MDNPAQLIQHVFLLVFIVLFLSVFVWFFLVSRLYKLLSANHPEIYRKLGEPTLFWNNSPKTAFSLLKFVFTKQYLGNNDINLEKLGGKMYAFFIMYTSLFALLFISFIVVALNAKP